MLFRSSVTKDKQQLKLQLASFQGPFDLLLHLIKQMKVDINDIPMAEITSQYLAYLHSMQELELDQAGDYLVMAATLLEIKSRLLLPIRYVPSCRIHHDMGDNFLAEDESRNQHGLHNKHDQKDAVGHMLHREP